MFDEVNEERNFNVGGFANNIEKLYELPGIDDMAGVILRGNFKNDRQLNAVLRLMYRHQKFADTKHQEMLRAKIAGTAAIGGVSRLEALFGGTNLVASDMYRAARGLPKLRKNDQERIVRGSDFRERDRPPEGGISGQ